MKSKHHKWSALMILQVLKSIAMVSGVLFEGKSLVPYGKLYDRDCLSKQIMICHTSKWYNIGGMEKYFRGISFMWNAIPINMLSYAVSNYIYIRFVLDGFRIFSLFISFLLTSYWVVPELLKLSMLFWLFLLILPWFFATAICDFIR